MAVTSAMLPMHDFDPEVTIPLLRKGSRTLSPQSTATPTSTGFGALSVETPTFSPAIPEINVDNVSDVCCLIDCGLVYPTCADEPDAPRMLFADFQRKVSGIVEEFFRGWDVAGAVVSLTSLQCESFHDEFVAIVLRMSFDRKESERNVMVALFGHLADQGALSPAQRARGLEKVILAWEDICLDVPDVAMQIADFFGAGLFHQALFLRLPEPLLRAIFCELPVGQQRDSLESHLEDLVGFKERLALRLEADLFCSRNPEMFVDWLRSEHRSVYHHVAVFAALVRSLDAMPSPAAFWTACFATDQLVVEKRKIVLTMLELLLGGDELFREESCIHIGFSRLIGVLDEYSRTFPEARQQVIALLAGAIEQQVLPAEFLKCARRLRWGGLEGVVAVRHCLRSTPLFSRRLWGSGDARQFTQDVQETIAEYFDSKNFDELALVVQELHLSGAEQVRFIRKFFTIGIERDEIEGALDAIDELTGYCWSPADIRDAVEQLQATFQDWKLDFPACRERTGDLIHAAAARGMLDSTDLLYHVSDLV